MIHATDDRGIKRAVIYTRVSREEQVDGYSLDAQETAAQQHALIRGKTGKSLTFQRVPHLLYLVLDGTSGSGEIDARYALVSGIGAALDKAGLFHPLDHLCHGRGLDVQTLGQFAVRKAFLLP